MIRTSTYSIKNRKTPEQRLAALGPFAARHGNVPKGTVLPDTQVPACPKVNVSELPQGFLPIKYLEALEHNQKISSCCRHPENHEIEARRSHPDEGAPDIYIFHCTCGRKHSRFCVGAEDEKRPHWESV
jgi:hypothetical protein